MPGEWGVGPYGSGPWGGALSNGGAPLVIPLDPEDGDAGVAQTAALSIRFTDEVAVNPATISVIVNGTAWVVGGVAVNGATMESAANIFNGFDISLHLPAPFPNGSTQTVIASAQNLASAVGSDTYSFLIGAGLRLLQVRNPFENVLLAYFNRPLAIDTAYFLITNWIVTPLTAKKPLTITEVVSRPGRADLGYLRYTGGGSGTYRLRVRNITAQDGTAIESGHDTADFELGFPDEDDPTIRLFDSIFGPLGISQRLVERRTIDGHVVDRALASALDEQLKLRVQRLDLSTTRSGKPGSGRL